MQRVGQRQSPCYLDLRLNQARTGQTRRQRIALRQRMPTYPRHSLRAAVAIAAALFVAVGGSAFASRGRLAQTTSPGQLGHRVSAGERHISAFSGALAVSSRKQQQLESEIAALERRIATVQAGLNTKRAEVIRLLEQVNSTRARLAMREAAAAQAQRLLADQLVDNYESEQPDLVTVVLEATGFADLLERLAFAQQIGSQGVRVVGQVEAARLAVAAEATQLGALQTRQEAATNASLEQRNRLARRRISLIQQRLAVLQTGRHTAAELARSRADVAQLQAEVSSVQQAQAAPVSPSPAGAPVPRTRAGARASLVFPLAKAAASPPATWSLAAGVDISAAATSPEYAICSGTIVLRGIGGLGSWAPVLHCDTPLAGHSYVFYGAAGPAGQLPVGSHVRAGQQLGSVGSGIVGISTGPHLELGFADASGTPIGARSASRLLSLLKAAYGS